MILIITESLDTRMNFRRYLRKNGILCQAPPPADFEASVASGRYSAVLFFAPFFPALCAMTSSRTVRVAVGEGVSAYSAQMSCFDDLYAPELLNFLFDIEGVMLPLHAGPIVRRGGRLFYTGFELKLSPSERSAVEYLLLRGEASGEELARVCVDDPYPADAERQKRYAAAVVSRINSKAVDVGGRKIIVFGGGCYRLVSAD